LSFRFIDRFGQTEVDNLGCHNALVLNAHNDIAWLDVPVNELLLVHRSQTGADLHRNLQSALYFKRSRALDEAVESFPLHKLHRIEVIPPLPPKMEDRSNVRVAAARASRKKRRRAVSSPRYLSLMTFNVTGHRRSTLNAL
jgi:hypothetical protein